MTLTFVCRTGEVLSREFTDEVGWRASVDFYTEDPRGYGDESYWNNIAIRNGSRVIVCGTNYLKGWVD